MEFNLRKLKNHSELADSENCMLICAVKISNVTSFLPTPVSLSALSCGVPQRTV